METSRDTSNNNNNARHDNNSESLDFYEAQDWELFGVESNEVHSELLELTIENCKKPNGLFQLLLTKDQQEILLKIIKNESWFDHSKGLNQKIAFGADDLNENVIKIFDNLLKNYPIIKSWIYSRKERCFVFNQMIANYYSKGDYVKDHVDLLSFQDGILICNLLGEATILFRHVDFTDWCHEIELKERNVLFLTGSSRFDWTHGILPLKCTKRISITLRQLAIDY